MLHISLIRVKHLQLELAWCFCWSTRQCWGQALCCSQHASAGLTPVSAFYFHFNRVLWVRKQAGEMWKQQVCTDVAVLCFSAQRADTLQCHLLLLGLTTAEKALWTRTQLKLQSDIAKKGAGALWNKGLDLAKPLFPAPAWSTVPVHRATRQRTEIPKEHRCAHYFHRKFYVRSIYPKLMPRKRILEWKDACRNTWNLVKEDDMFMKNSQEGE